MKHILNVCNSISSVKYLRVENGMILSVYSLVSLKLSTERELSETKCPDAEKSNTRYLHCSPAHPPLRDTTNTGNGFEALSHVTVRS
jgi:hypothetical protein